MISCPHSNSALVFDGGQKSAKKFEQKEAKVTKGQRDWRSGMVLRQIPVWASNVRQAWSLTADRSSKEI